MQINALSTGPTQNAGETKVAELDDSGFGEEDVLWLYITVDALQQTPSVRDLGNMIHSLLVTKKEVYIKADRLAIRNLYTF